MNQFALDHGWEKLTSREKCEEFLASIPGKRKIVLFTNMLIEMTLGKFYDDLVDFNEGSIRVKKLDFIDRSEGSQYMIANLYESMFNNGGLYKIFADKMYAKFCGKIEGATYFDGIKLKSFEERAQILQAKKLRPEMEQRFRESLKKQITSLYYNIFPVDVGSEPTVMQ